MEKINKPISLSVRNYIQRKLSVKLMISEDIIDQVIADSGKQIQEAMKKENSVELSGFGKLVFRKKLALKDISSYTKTANLFKEQLLTATDAEKVKIQKKLDTVEEILTYLKARINE